MPRFNDEKGKLGHYLRPNLYLNSTASQRAGCLLILVRVCVNPPFTQATSPTLCSITVAGLPSTSFRSSQSASAITRFSVRSCRINLIRPAPNASRIAVSLLRSVALARSELARSFRPGGSGPSRSFRTRSARSDG